jgi:hypothetical protein
VKEKGQGGPDQKPTSQNNAYLKEQGKPSPGFPALKPEQPPHGGGIKSLERQAIPSGWDVLERRVKLGAEFNAGHRTYEEYERERRKLNLLSNEISDKRSARDKLILKLHAEITIQPVDSQPVPFKIITLSPEEFQQFRSKVESMSDDEIREEIRKAEEEFRRKSKEVDKKRGGDDDDDDFTLAMP